MRTSMGEITIRLFPDKAPISVANFLSYVDEGFYNGTIFHRVTEGYVIQGGGFTTNMVKKETRPPIKNEAGNGLSNRRGTVAMARINLVDSATSQFFINIADNTFIDHKNDTPKDFGYAVFGEVISGMDVVDRISAVKTGSRGPFPADCPLESVTIVSITRAPAQLRCRALLPLHREQLDLAEAVGAEERPQRIVRAHQALDRRHPELVEHVEHGLDQPGADVAPAEFGMHADGHDTPAARDPELIGLDVADHESHHLLADLRHLTRARARARSSRRPPRRDTRRAFRARTPPSSLR